MSPDSFSQTGPVASAPGFMSGVERARPTPGSPRRKPGDLHRIALLCLPGIIAAAFAGCGPRGPERFQLAGTVTFAGKPVPSGLIRFEPDASRGNHGPVGYAAIKDGRYTTDTKGCKGALEGPLVVFMTGGPAPDPKVEMPTMWFCDYASSITLEPKGGAATFDFDVPTSASAR